jgi:hypothetical protein
MNQKKVKTIRKWLRTQDVEPTEGRMMGRVVGNRLLGWNEPDLPGGDPIPVIVEVQQALCSGGRKCYKSMKSLVARNDGTLELLRQSIAGAPTEA